MGERRCRSRGNASEKGHSSRSSHSRSKSKDYRRDRRDYKSEPKEYRYERRTPEKQQPRRNDNSDYVKSPRSSPKNSATIERSIKVEKEEERRSDLEEGELGSTDEDEDPSADQTKFR